MPYKDPERKRQWEREHREQRNAQRRMQRLSEPSRYVSAPRPAPDISSSRKSQATWKTILGWTLGIGFVLLAALAGASLPTPGDLGASPGPGNPGMS